MSYTEVKKEVGLCVARCNWDILLQPKFKLFLQHTSALSGVDQISLLVLKLLPF
jgi:hypothetical protein